MFKDSELLTGRAFGQQSLRENRTENDVTIPPASIITLSDGTAFTLGYEFVGSGFNLAFNVLVNDVNSGEFAYAIECRKGVVKMHGPGGWKTWSRKSRTFM